MLSSRLKIIFDGFFVIHVTYAGYTSLTEVCFAPKPPPILGLLTRIMVFGIWSALEMIRRQWKTIWVELTTFKRP